ncbi:MAG TPA: S8/S53 family peptidase, partial [Thermopolyspora sp.]
NAAQIGEPVAGVVRIAVGGTSVLETVAAAEDALGRRGMVTPNHIVSVAPQGKCPADEPIPAPGPGVPLGTPQQDVVNPQRNLATNIGAGIKVTVIDNGLAEKYDVDFSWLLDGVTGDVVPDDGVIGPYEGHGTFIAGLLRCVAPALHVHVSADLADAGAMTELDFCGALLNALPAGDAPAIISVSAGGTTAGNVPYLGLDAVIDALNAHPQTLLVAAAGNNGNQVPFWPAALAGPYPQPTPGVLSVGALRQDGAGIACFSNYGPWVNVYAPGERLVGVFGSGTYTYTEPPSADCRYHTSPRLYDDCTCRGTPAQGSTGSFTGLATWSGTSFATPIVAAIIATRMWQTGETSRQAAQALIAGAGSVLGAGPALLPLLWTPTPVEPGT